MSAVQQLNLVRLAGRVKLTSNGDNAKTAKVSVVARTPEVADTIYGPLVHDLSGMTVERSKIRLNWEHGGNIGYLNHFDTSSGELVCSGAIVPISDGADAEVEGVCSDIDVNALIQRMAAGIPYEASIETDLDDAVMEVVPTGATTQANGQTYQGPLLVVRQWTLEAVAICEDGADEGTSAELQLSKKNVEGGKKGFFVRLSKTSKKVGEIKMSNEEVKPVQAVEAKVEAKAVEAVVKAEDQKPVEDSVEAIVAVEAVKTDEKTEAVVAEVAKAADVPVAAVAEVKAELAEAVALSAKVEPVDPQKLAQELVVQFSKEFGDKAVAYLSEGLTINDARVKFSAALRVENEDLRKRLSTIDRGAAKPITFSSDRSDPAKSDAMIRIRK